MLNEGGPKVIIQNLITQSEKIIRQFSPATYFEWRDGNSYDSLIGMLVNFGKAVEAAKKTKSDWKEIKATFSADTQKRIESVTTLSKRNLSSQSIYKYEQREELKSNLLKIFEGISSEINTTADAAMTVGQAEAEARRYAETPSNQIFFPSKGKGTYNVNQLIAEDIAAKLGVSKPDAELIASMLDVKLVEGSTAETPQNIRYAVRFNETARPAIKIPALPPVTETFVPPTFVATLNPNHPNGFHDGSLFVSPLRQHRRK